MNAQAPVRVPRPFLAGAIPRLSEDISRHQRLRDLRNQINWCYAVLGEY
jgi:hypothetical protein